MENIVYNNSRYKNKKQMIISLYYSIFEHFLNFKMLIISSPY